MSSNHRPSPPSILQHSVGRHDESFVARESRAGGGAAAIAKKVSIYFFHMLLLYYLIMSSNHLSSFNPSAQRWAPRREVRCEGIADGGGGSGNRKKGEYLFFSYVIIYHVI